MNWGSKEWLEDQLTPSDKDGDKWGHKWRGSQKLRHANIIKIIKNCIDSSVKKNILDIGCSHGDFTKLLVKSFKNAKVYGTDISDVAINEASKNIPSGFFEVSSLPEIPFENRKFDMILSLEVLYYLSNKDREKSLKNICDRLDNDGYYIFSAVINKGEQYFSERSAKELIEKYFTIEDCYFAHAKLYNIIEKPLNKIVKINTRLQKNTENKNIFSGKKQKVWSFIVKIKLDLFIKTIIKIVSFFARKIISSAKVASICENISKKMFTNQSKSSIIIIARKN